MRKNANHEKDKHTKYALEHCGEEGSDSYATQRRESKKEGEDR